MNNAWNKGIYRGVHPGGTPKVRSTPRPIQYGYGHSFYFLASTQNPVSTKDTKPNARIGKFFAGKNTFSVESKTQKVFKYPLNWLYLSVFRYATKRPRMAQKRKTK